MGYNVVSDDCPSLVVNQHGNNAPGKCAVESICPRVTGWALQASLHMSAHPAQHED